MAGMVPNLTHQLAYQSRCKGREPLREIATTVEAVSLEQAAVALGSAASAIFSLSRVVLLPSEV